MATARPELSAVNGWMEDGPTRSRFQPLFLRLIEIADTLEALLTALSTVTIDDNDISPAGFVMSMFSPSGALACACFGSSQQDEFLASLPTLKGRHEYAASEQEERASTPEVA